MSSRNRSRSSWAPPIAAMAAALVASALTLGTNVNRADAAKAPSSTVKVQVETYPAMESDPGVDLDSMGLKKGKAKAKTISFDTVPQAQAPKIAERLKLVEQLLVRHQRAYDYRSLTTTQLAAILKRLDDEAQVFAPPVEPEE